MLSRMNDEAVQGRGVKYVQLCHLWNDTYKYHWNNTSFYAYNLVTVHFKDFPVVCELQVGFTQ